MIIYKITNLINNKVYIGQTTRTLAKRWKSHCAKDNSNRPVGNAVLKYGLDNFKVEEIENCLTIEQLNDRESYWISYYNSTDKKLGYNLCSGGNNKVMSEETIEKIRVKALARKSTISAANRDAINKVVRGSKMPDHVREALRNANVGKKLSTEQIEKMREFNLGKKASEETKKKMSDVRKILGIPKDQLDKMHEARRKKGFNHSEESKEKIRLKKLGKKQSPETIRKRIETRQRNKNLKQQ